MSEVIVPAAEAGIARHGQSYDPRAATRSILLSVFVNGVLPFLLYKFLVPYFRPASVMPLVYASAFPILGLTMSYVRTGAMDMIAILALVSIGYSAISALLAGEIRLGMIIGATQGFPIAALFVGSALVGRPIIFYIARQFVAGNDPARRAIFKSVNIADGGRTCRVATYIWAVGIAGLGAISLAMADTLPPATYLLANNIVNTAVSVVLVIWSFRFVRMRLERVHDQLEAAPQQRPSIVP